MARRTFWIALLITVAGFAASFIDWTPGLATIVTFGAIVTITAGIAWAASSFRQRHGSAAPTATHPQPSRAGRTAGKPWYPPQQGQSSPQ